MHSVERFSTLAHKPPQRLEIWNQIAEETFTGTRIRSDDPLFAAEMWRWRLDDLVMMRPRTPRGQVERSSGSNDQSRLVLHVQHRSRTRFRQRGRVAELGTGDMDINFALEPYQVDLMDGNELLCVEMPIQPLLDRLPNLEHAICRRISGQSAAVQVLHSYVLSLWQGGLNELQTPDWQRDAVDALYSLVAGALRERPSTHDEGALLGRLKAIVAARLTDPDLSTLALATDAGVSPRSVQSAFAVGRTTPSIYITNARLDLAAEWLQVHVARSVTDIALSVGFNDSAYFSRCFRNRFGASPRDSRRR